MCKSPLEPAGHRQRPAGLAQRAVAWLVLHFCLVVLGTPFAPRMAVGDERPTPRPNILWITSEDNGQELGCYDDAFATTPNLDALAARGMRYQHVWSNAPVCAPARTTLLTGRYPTTLGAQHMRSDVPVPADLALYPATLRQAGYYCCNRSKQDYNIQTPSDLWDDSSPRAHWRNRAPGQPFMAVVNLTVSHESQIRTRPHQAVHDPAKVPLPPFHPDRPEIRQDWAQYYDKVSEMDRQVGQWLAELERDGLRENTIVFYYGDHGTGMPRGKRWLYETGLRVPLIVWTPAAYRDRVGPEYQPGTANARLVSFVDLFPTLLSLIGAEIPADLPGSAFLGPQTGAPPQYLFGFRDRMDERYDLSRAVRDSRYAYIRNYWPQLPQGQYLDYMFQTPTTRVWQAAFQAGQCTPAQAAFWQSKPVEELYDLETDPHQVHNLAADPQQQTVLTRLRAALRQHLLATRDLGFLPESDVWERAGERPPAELGQSSAEIPWERILAAAELATSPDRDSAQACLAGLSDPDAAVRYWSLAGLLWDAQRSAADEFSAEDQARIAALSRQDPSSAVRGIACRWLAQAPNSTESEAGLENDSRPEPDASAAARRAQAVQQLVVDATGESASFWQRVESLNALVHCQPTAGELHPHWAALSQLNRTGPPRQEFYLQRLLEVLPRQMNVVVLVSDDQRWDSLGATGNPHIQTPHLDRLARTGVHFTQARVTTSICMTSRASILTGQTMSRHGIDRFGRPIEPSAFANTYPGRLRADGYWTGFVGKYGVGAPRASDFDFLRAYEGRHWMERQGETVHVTELNRRDALEFLQQRPTDRPFLLSVSFFAPHAEDGHPDQYRPQAWSEAWYKDKEIPPSAWGAERFQTALPEFLRAPQNEGRVRFGWRFDSPENYQHSMQNYYRLITEVDAAVGDLVAELERQGVAENTVVLFIGDNGYFHADRGLADKWYPYDQALRVPLIVFDPRLGNGKRGAKREDWVLNIDVAPTVLRAAGLEPTADIEGRDMSPLYLAGQAPEWRQSFVYEHPTITSRERIPSSQAIIRPDSKYVWWPEWQYEQWFDLRSDPDEVINLAELPEHSDSLPAFRAELQRWFERPHP